MPTTTQKMRPGGVAAAPVFCDAVAGDPGDQMAEADDRAADRMELEYLRIERLEEFPVRIVGAELLLPQDHFAFGGEPFGGELRMTHHGGEHVDCGFEMNPGEMGVIGGMVETGVSVDRTAEAVDGVGGGGAGIVAASLE
ncbi:MAG: hypothetical protein L6W00_01480 [Lentisphaeria bacterium]|nr:MAG: hypothetical protein L6W00_01480 [Lentisphaeria bacterium]